MDRRQYDAAMRQAFENGRLQGQQDGSLDIDAGMRAQVAELRREFDNKLNRQAGGLRKHVDEKTAHVGQSLGELANIANALTTERSGGDGVGGPTHGHRDEGNIVRPGTIRIEDIPGRRVPYTMLVDIAIGNNTTSERQASVTISQEGPFVAVKRMAIFQSAFEAQTTDPTSGQVARFSGRSFGRYRPIASSWDLLDGQSNSRGDSATWWMSAIANPGIAIGDPLPSAVLGLPSNISSFRTMEFDGRIEVINAGSSYPRQNISVPSAFWSQAINAPWDLGALDFFERGEVLTLKVQPLHVNNPPVGNVDSSCIFPQTANGGTGWPFIEGQYDAHEGICTPGAATLGDDVILRPNVLATDSVQRLPDGILTLGWEGYRILQPIGPAV